MSFGSENNSGIWTKTGTTEGTIPIASDVLFNNNKNLGFFVEDSVKKKLTTDLTPISGKNLSTRNSISPTQKGNIMRILYF